jgi:hypothetical protein
MPPPPGLALDAAPRSRLRAALPLLLLLLAAALGALLLLAPQQLLSPQVRARRVAAALVLTAAAAGERSLRAVVSGAGPAAPPSSSAASFAATRARAERPFRAVVRIHSLACGTEKGDAYRPHFTYTLFPPDGAYPVLVVADVALVCATRTLTLVSRHYFRRPDLDHTRLVVHVRDRASGARVRLAARSWHVSRKYETVAIGEFEYDGGVACDGAAAAAAAPGGDDARDAPTVEVEVSYSGTGTGAASCPNARSTFAVARSPSPPRSRWAMVAVFSFSRFLLRAWMDYWRAIGVGTFYLFHNGRSDELESVMASFDNDLRASIVLVDWQVLHWILTDDADVTHGQPMAINDALRRWHHLHDFMLFYDTDEFLVLQRHQNLDDFVNAYARQIGPFSALRTPCSWALLDPTASGGGGFDVSNVTLLDLVSRPIVRGKPANREKYLLNASAVDAIGIKNINIHGVYSFDNRESPEQRPQLLVSDVGEFPAFHLHLLNEVGEARKLDSRETFLPREGRINDTDLRAFVLRAMTARRSARRKQR